MVSDLLSVEGPATAASATSETKVKRQSTPTRYLVLRREPDENYWKVVGDLEAVGSDAAARKVASDGEHEGEYVAVPARSWKPTRIEFEQTTRMKVTPAG